MALYLVLGYTRKSKEKIMRKYTLKTIHKVWKFSLQPRTTNQAIADRFKLTIGQVKYIRYQLMYDHRKDMESLEPMSNPLRPQELAVAKKLRVPPHQYRQAKHELNLSRRISVTERFLKENSQQSMIEEWEVATLAHEVLKRCSFDIDGNLVVRNSPLLEKYTKKIKKELAKEVEKEEFAE